MYDYFLTGFLNFSCIGGANVAVSGWLRFVKKKKKLDYSQFAQTTLTIEVFLVMKCYLFLQVFLAVWISLALSLTPKAFTADRNETQSYFQFKIKVGFSCVTLDF